MSRMPHIHGLRGENDICPACPAVVRLPREQSFSIPGEWPSLNVLLYGHVRTKMKIKREWQTAAGWAIRAAKVLPMGRVFISYEHHRKDWRVDLDNAAGFASKIVQDALVECGILGGDTFECVAGFSHTFVLDKGSPGLSVKLEER